MSSPHSPKNVSLPSINELFPEHLLAAPPSPIRRYPSSSLRTCPTSRYPPEPNFNYPQTSAIVAVPARPRQDAAQPASPGGRGDVGRPYNAYAAPSVPPGPHSGAPCPGACCGPPGRPGHPGAAPQGSYPPGGYGTQAPTAHPPLAASLEDAASIASGAEPRRGAHPGAFGYAGDAAMASITKAKPAFRVELRVPECAPSTGPPSAPAFDGFPRADERHGPAGGYPSAFAANPFLSGAATPGGGQALRAPQSPQDGGGQGAEEKRHCCPHCNKRFNRPSSLNIHVNTHTGAKPFVCSYPGCNRRFNVNSNMRRHYRNHLTARRRDAVARLIQHPSGSSPSPSTSASASPSRSPEPAYSPTYAHAQPYGAHALDRRTASYSDPEDLDGCARARAVKRETPEPAPALGARESGMRDGERAPCRLRANSSPMPRFREDRVVRHAEPACDRPGCSCNARPVSTALRPAFPEYLPAGGGERARPY